MLQTTLKPTQSQFYSGRRLGAGVPVPGVPQQDCGPRVGSRRLAEPFDTFGPRATVALDANACRFSST